MIKRIIIIIIESLFMFIAGNWKMNCNVKEAGEIAENLSSLECLSSNIEVAVFPPFILLPEVYQKLHSSTILIGAQDCSQYSNGAYTGQVSLEMLREFGCSHVILGHSERRTLLNESSSIVKLKSIKAVNYGLKPIICIGETLLERENHTYLSTIEKQLKNSLPDFNEIDYQDKEIIIAYEPIWAIGTGKVASEKNIYEIHTFIYNLLINDFNYIKNFKIIYGGSVKSSNASIIRNIKNVDGVLVGGASIDAKEFIEIIKKFN